MTASATPAQLKAQVRAAAAIGEAIRDLGRVPAGHLYAHLMGKLTLDQFDGLVGALVQAKLVERTRDHELIWIGPAA